jgi:hypothetical protein
LLLYYGIKKYYNIENKKFKLSNELIDKIKKRFVLDQHTGCIYNNQSEYFKLFNDLKKENDLQLD